MNNISLPMNIEEIIPEIDVSHLVNRFVESIPHSEFDAYYQQYGAPSYHPRMMLKIILYSYTQKEFSGRNIEFNLKDSVRLRWLAQEQTSSYRTINRFRSNPYTSRLLEICFTQFSTMLMSEGKMSSDRIFIDGTKLQKICKICRVISHRFCTKPQIRCRNYEF